MSREKLDGEALAQIVAFATVEAIEAGYLDRFLNRLRGAITLRERVVPATLQVPRLLGVWTKVASFTITSGTRKYTVKVGDPVAVSGEGKGGGISRGWRVLSIDQHADGRINVEVKNDRLSHSRIFRGKQLVYVRPPKK